ncbi:hypothetical protein AZE42_12710 [Rhizopogon vesiculosus]|uniref:Uncharacterized protein n=1 Tax=Rhizopogon vesiculosus TaxID=180088 RepID=A0A1J8R5M4_9AGAM|nr:hypothetical protein AZE42_12710 [Rhizopogon vesiculosus]
MEGQAPWRWNQQGKGTSVSPFPTTSAPAVPLPPISAFTGLETAAAAFFGDLSGSLHDLGFGHYDNAYSGPFLLLDLFYRECRHSAHS